MLPATFSEHPSSYFKNRLPASSPLDSFERNSGWWEKKLFLAKKKGWRATTIALRFSSFQVLSSYFRASRITQRSTFAPRLLTFPRRRFVLDLLYNSLMQQNSGYISRLLCSSEINSSTRTTLTRKTYEYMADSLLV